MQSPLEPDFELDEGAHSQEVNSYMDECFPQAVEGENYDPNCTGIKKEPQAINNKGERSYSQIDNSQLEMGDLSFLNSSVPNVNFPEKYQEQLQLISSIRSQLRGTKQQLRWVKLSKQGFQQENYTIKQLLLEKKTLICKLNNDLEKSNHQINRLQDQLQDYQQKAYAANEQNQALLSTQKSLKTKLKQMKKQIQSKQQSLMQFVQKTKQDKAQSQIYLIKQRERLFQRGRKQMKIILDESENYSMAQPEATASKDHTKIQEVFLTKLRQLKEQLDSKEREARNLESQLYEKEQFRVVLEKRNRILEQQFNEATNLLSEQKQLYMQKRAELVQTQTKVSEVKSVSRENRKKIQSKNHEQFSSIIQTLAPILPKSILTCLEGYRSFHQNYQSFKSQLEGQIVIYLRQRNLVTAIEQQNVSLRKQLSQLEQEFDILDLKYQTLKRQYDAVTGDNRRLLKLNTLSRYRTDRNQSKSQKEGSQKENNINLLNQTPAMDDRKVITQNRTRR